MDVVIEVLLGVLVLVVLVWVVIFGGIGALVAGLRGASRLEGFVWGALLGPVGWLVILWRTRGGRLRAPVAPPVAVDPPSLGTPRADEADPEGHVF